MRSLQLRQYGVRAWLGLGLVCLIFLVGTGGAFSSLGVLLPAMLSDFGWTWTQGGSLFTALGLATGLSSTLPAFFIRRSGVRLCYVVGGGFLGAGFGAMALMDGYIGYLIATTFVGIGYTVAGAVPAVRALSVWFKDHSSVMIGAFFTSGAVGSILGPVSASFFVEVLQDWRLYWVFIGLLSGGLCAIAAWLIPDTLEKEGVSKSSGAKTTSSEPVVNWTLAQVLRTPQYYIIVFGVTVTLLGALTMNAWQVTHMQNLGVASQIAAAALSAHAICNAASRAVGGFVIDKIGAKWVMASGLFAGVVGMAALSVADSPVLIALFAIGDGYSFGIVTFASAILILKYFGIEHNPAILGVLNLFTTAAMIGPIAAGRVAEGLGGFTSVFLACSLILFLAFISLVAMPKPELKSAKESTPAT